MSDQSGTGADGAANEAAAENTPAESEAPAWLGPINERMNELRDQNASIVERLENYQQEPEYEVDEDEFDEADYYDAEGELTPEGAQALIDSRVDERLQEQLGQRDAQTAMVEREDAFDALRDEIPALQDDKAAAALVRDTAAWCHQTGNEHLINTPAFVDLLEDRYYSGQFRERAAAEREQGSEREVVLESASGASAPSKSKEPDWGERIVKAAERLRPSI